MILQRIATSLKKRDWSTVVLEVLIVVVGIFIGLQVDDWNERRKDRAEELVILERLAAEVNVAIEDVRVDINQLKMRAADADFVISALSAGNVPEGGELRFAAGIVGAPRIEQPFSGMATIRELQNTGKITLIRDSEIRAAISALEDSYERAKIYTGFVGARLVPLSATIDTYVRRIEFGEGNSWTLEYDLGELAASRGFHFALGNLASLLVNNQVWMQEHLASLESLQLALEAHR